ncbi:hypothetical protein GH714_038199 [Hevea brasiliensis]|uniref:Brix domain-containing protein n=1 Tax=Hevea brasiliensis TaxID=3981 RepID=A0A6A6MPH2_HEVBR|nr:hypothetical protein GH714_038199 [Hevea brasiliensis]
MAEYENDVELDTSDKKRDKRKKKNKEGEEKREILPSMIKNKEKRSVVHAKLKHLKKVEKRKKLKARDASEKRSLELGEEPPPRQIPRTIENTREFDETICKPDDDELFAGNDADEFSSVLRRELTPKILITTCRFNSTRGPLFISELLSVIPNAIYKKRGTYNLKDIVKYASNMEFTAIIDVHTNRREPDALLIICLPYGPTAHFKLSNLVLRKDIKNHGNPTNHKPELVLTNFTTRLGHRVGRLIQSLFPQDPNFRGRRVVTFHNQRDFIFFRHHRRKWTLAEGGFSSELHQRSFKFPFVEEVQAIMVNWVGSRTHDVLELQFIKEVFDEMVKRDCIMECVDFGFAQGSESTEVLALFKRMEEFWVGNQELVHMYQERLGDAGYITFQLARTNNRGDGLLTAVHKDYFSVLNYQELLFNDFGDRVAQLLHVQSAVPLMQNQNGLAQQEFLIVNTHLLFPHDSSLSIVRLNQVYKILRCVETYQRENKLSHMPIILCGDWNGSKHGHVYKFLRSQGFDSSYDIAHQYTDSDADAHKWVSHRNHRGNICGVDFIWLRNPIKSRKLLKASWAEAVFGIIKVQLLKASLNESDAFAYLRLTSLETKDLWILADIDGNGIVDYEEFKLTIWRSACLEQEEDCASTKETEPGVEEAIGFTVKDAALFPREAEKGMWPENYSLSDHARLTVVFSPERMLCSRKIL